jgi:hypothetical protein
MHTTSFPGPFDDRWRYLGSFGFIETPGADTNSNQTLRNGNWNDMRRRWHRRYCAGFAPTSRDCAHDTAALKSVVAHDKARFLFFDRPWRPEAALAGRLARREAAKASTGMCQSLL